MSSIEMRPNGVSGPVWRVRFRTGGKQRVVTFATEKAATKWQGVLDAVGPATALAMLEAPPPATDRTVGQQVSHHIEHLTGVTEGTRKTYRAVVANDMDTIADLPLTMLTRDAVAGWVNALHERCLSGKTIANRHGLLSAAMNSAVDDELIGKNPCRGMRLPRSDGHEMVFLTREQYAALHQLLPEHYRPLALTLVGTGMRFGEATALQVRDVDLANRTVRVRQAWKHTGASSKRELGPPKTKRGRRTIPLSPPVVAALAPLVDGRKPGAFVFTTTQGQPVKQATFWKVWTAAASAYQPDKDRRPRIHDLRHTFASWAISANIPLPVLQRTLGHESITTTVDRYGHLARTDFDALATATGAYLPDLKALEG